MRCRGQKKNLMPQIKVSHTFVEDGAAGFDGESALGSDLMAVDMAEEPFVFEFKVTAGTCLCEGDVSWAARLGGL